MKTLKIPLRAVLYKEDGDWYAHCLEFDLIGSGNTINDALASLAETILVQIDACIRHKALESLFRPAEGKYLKMFAAGKNVAHGALEMKLRQQTETKQVEIETLDAREYTESAESDADLALA